MPAHLSDLPLVDPQLLHRACEEQRLPTGRWWGAATSYRCPLTTDARGRRYGTASVLMLPEHYERLPEDRDHLKLTIADDTGEKFVIQPLTVTGLEVAVPSDPTDAGAVYLLELADLRYRLGQVAVLRQYNTIDATGQYVYAHLNAGVPWTWESLVADLWAKMLDACPDDLHPLPPEIPVGHLGGATPQGFYFYHDDAWTALCRVAEAMGLYCRYNPTKPIRYQIDFVEVEAVGSDYSAEDKAFKVWESYPAAEILPPWPENVVVTFPAMGRNERYPVSVATGELAVAGTSVMVMDDLPYVGSNATACSDRAQAVAAVWKWSFRAAWTDDVREFHRVALSVPPTLGYDGAAEWAVFDLRGGWGGGINTTVAGRDIFVDRDRPYFIDPSAAGGDGSGPDGGSGSGGFYGRLIDYTYRDDCLGGVVYRFRNTWYESSEDGKVYTTGYSFERINGCCECASGSGSSTGPSDGISTACGTVSRILKVTYSTGAVFYITYYEVLDAWYGYTETASGCQTGSASLTMQCVADTTWNLNSVATYRGPTAAPATATSTSPFLLMYTGPDGTCGGSVSLTVTEA